MLHEIGHVFGCSHEAIAEFWQAPSYMSYAYKLPNGFCTIMASQAQCLPGNPYTRFPETAKIRKKLPKPDTIFFEKGIP